MGTDNETKFTKLDTANAKLEEKTLPLRQRLVKNLKTWFANNYWWVLGFKILPSIFLVGAFGGRPIRIGKLAAPSTVASFDSFLNYILGPMLILALVDTLHIGLNIFEEQWKIREYKKRKSEYENADDTEDKHPLEKEIKALREEKIDKIQIPAGKDKATFIKETIFDDKFRKVLKTHGLNEDVFIDMLLRVNHYEYGPHDFLVNADKPDDSNAIANTLKPLLSLPEHNYQALWLQAQISLSRALYERYKEHAPKEGKELTAFIQVNLFSARLHKQLRAMKIDEDKFTKQVLDTVPPEQAAKKLYKKDKKGSFDYASDWLKTEIRCMRMKEDPSLPVHLETMLIEAKLDKKNFADAVIQKNQTNTQYYEYNHSKIVDKFHCPTTDKSFAKEHPLAAKGIRFFDHTKRLFIFPFRMLTLMLALEKLLPYSLPLQYSIPIYVSAGLTLSLLIIFLEQMSDDYQDELQETRSNQLNELHEAEQASGVNRLFLRTEHWEDQQAIARLKQQKEDQENQLETMKRSSSALFISSQAGKAHMVPVQEREDSPSFGSPPMPMSMSTEMDRKKDSSHQVGGKI